MPLGGRRTITFVMLTPSLGIIAGTRLTGTGSRLDAAVTPPTAAAAATPTTATREEIVEALHAVEDPELGMDIVDLGLLYDVEVEGSAVKVSYTLTSMGCPAGAMIQEDIDRVVSELPGVEQVQSELTFEPPWTPDRMSDDAKFILGF